MTIAMTIGADPAPPALPPAVTAPFGGGVCVPITFGDPESAAELVGVGDPALDAPGVVGEAGGGAVGGTVDGAAVARLVGCGVGRFVGVGGVVTRATTLMTPRITSGWTSQKYG